MASSVFPFAGGTFIGQEGTIVLAATTTTLITFSVVFTSVTSYAVFATLVDVLAAPTFVQLQAVSNTTFNIRNTDASQHTINWVAVGF
jgi:hypothetical protein